MESTETTLWVSEEAYRQGAPFLVALAVAGARAEYIPDPWEFDPAFWARIEENLEAARAAIEECTLGRLLAWKAAA